MVEVAGTRDLARRGHDVERRPADQVTLSALQHVRASIGVNIPVTRATDPRAILTYLLWDTFDGPLYCGSGMDGVRDADTDTTRLVRRGTRHVAERRRGAGYGTVATGRRVGPRTSSRRSVHALSQRLDDGDGCGRVDRLRLAGSVMANPRAIRTGRQAVRRETWIIRR